MHRGSLKSLLSGNNAPVIMPFVPKREVGIRCIPDFFRREIQNLVKRQQAEYSFCQFGDRQMRARIYQPAPSAMQSGTARSKIWILEFEPESSGSIDPLMGWTGSSDTRNQVRLEFGSREDAVSYARSKGIAFRESSPNLRKPILRKRGYGENFAHNRKESWTH